MQYIFPLRYKALHDGHQNLLSSSLFRAFFNASPLGSFLYIAIALCQYIVPLFFIYILSELVLAQSDHSFVARQTAYLLALGFLTCVLALAKLNLERVFSLRFCQEFENLINKKISAKLELSVLERIASRDLNIILDGFGPSIDLVVIPIFLLSTGTIALLNYGGAGFLGISVILIFVPVSYLLSKFSDRNYRSIMDMAARRIEKSSNWIREGPLLKQFGTSQTLKDIKTDLRKELFSRNLDSALRGADSYIIGFGRLVPYVVLVALGGLSSSTIWDGAIFWLCIPLLAALLGLPKAYLSYKAVCRAIEQLDFLRSNLDESQAPEVAQRKLNPRLVEFDKGWPLWPGPLIELLPGARDISEVELGNLFEAFHLIPEIGRDVQEVSQRFVEMDGKNISEGQKLRLQLLRAVLLTRPAELGLFIDDDFAALDQNAVQAVARVFERLPNVELSGRAMSAIESRRSTDRSAVPRAAPAHLPPTNTVTSDFNIFELIKSNVWGIPLLLVPAGMMSYAGNLTLPEAEFSGIEIIGYLVVGILLGICSGLLVEHQLRRRFARQLVSGLENVQVSELAGAVQTVSRDVTTSFERISWYAHDIFWVIALLVCSGVTLWGGFGLPGIAIAALFCVALFAVYKIFINDLYATRLATISGFDALIRSTHLAFVFSRNFGPGFARWQSWLETTKRATIKNGIEAFYLTRMRSLSTRTMMAISCRIVSDAIILLVVLFGVVYRERVSNFVLAVTVLLLVRSDLSNFFLAITGFKSQAVSVSRLRSFSRKKSRVAISVEVSLVQVSPFFSRRNYCGLTLRKGVLHSLSGNSGSGKSDYLKGLAGVSDTELVDPQVQPLGAAKTYYIDKHALGLLNFDKLTGPEFLLKWIEELPKDGLQILFLDEVFLDLTTEELSRYLRAFQDYALYSGNTLIVVDHRIELENNIDLESICV